jgi:hypothetical protein
MVEVRVRRLEWTAGEIFVPYPAAHRPERPGRLDAHLFSEAARRDDLQLRGRDVLYVAVGYGVVGGVVLVVNATARSADRECPRTSRWREE